MEIILTTDYLSIKIELLLAYFGGIQCYRLLELKALS